MTLKSYLQHFYFIEGLYFQVIILYEYICMSDFLLEEVSFILILFIHVILIYSILNE